MEFCTQENYISRLRTKSKTFSENQKPREFAARRTSQKEILKDELQAKGKQSQIEGLQSKKERRVRGW